MADRVVKLKGQKPAKGPAFVLRRAKAGSAETYPFVVGYIDEHGVEDFRGLQEYLTYDAALKAAEERAHEVRLPLRNDTGVTSKQPEKTAQKLTSPSKAGPAKKGTRPELQLRDTTPIASYFQLPEVDRRVEEFDGDLIVDRAFALFHNTRDQLVDLHEECHGGSRDHAVRYSQKLHDQIQAQLRHLNVDLVDSAMVQYALAEALLKRIEALESNVLSADNVDCQVLDDDRTVELSFGSGERQRVISVKWPVAIDRGVFKQGQTYEPGDGVTWGGSWWIAQRQTSAKPDTPDSGFRLAVKRGRDGRDAKGGQK